MSTEWRQHTRATECATTGWRIQRRKSSRPFELGEGRYRESTRLTGDARFTPTLFPGLEISLPSLWR